MELETLSCNNCGAPVEVPRGVDYVTCAHCRSRLEVKRTETSAYTEVLDRLDERTARMAEDLEAIRSDTEVEQIDREWQMEREKYLEHDEHGSSSVPSTGGVVAVVIVGVIAFVLVVVWLGSFLSSTGGMGGGGPFGSGSPLGSGGPASPGDGISTFFILGAVLMVVIIVISIVGALVRKSGYDEAETTYRVKRMSALNRTKSGPENKPRRISR